MKYRPPQAIRLTAQESKWYERVLEPCRPSGEWAPVAQAMEGLLTSLYERNAIPDIRLRIFEDPVLAEAGSKSPRQVFESNGTCGQNICRHPHFVPYLKYFVNGPDLPLSVTRGFCEVLNEDAGTSGMVLTQLGRFVRSSIRQHGLDRHSAATQFYRLAVELDIPYDCHEIRTTALSAG